ncbi:MAG: TIGR01777 family oxidoreductase [Thermoleophilia bacterium]|jgi:uncharacterized protein (TIGR01777 family)|nr:TIGR01777 family oxidoreductase [Thermoleophilia bacterium]
MRVAIVGASGLIGRRLVAALVARGDAVVPVSRRAGAVDGVAAVTWDPVAGPPPAAMLDGVDAVVNLAGASIDGGRWTAERKRLIRDSRVITTGRIADALAAGGGPRVLVNGSAVGFYGSRAEEVDETSAPGTGFLADTCVEWEAAAAPAASGGVRVVLARTGIVLAREGGALPRLATVTKMFMGGPLGGGRQWMPWIAMEDQIGLLLACLADDRYRGPVNLTAPHPVRQREFAAALGRVLGRPSLVPTPAVAVKAMMGEMAEIALEGQRALPKVALANGYAFRCTDLETAIRAELRQEAPATA